MHTFRPSRGRILFEVLCAIGIAASFAGGWIETGAWAFLPAAGIAALYGLVHAFDLGRSTALADQGADVPLTASGRQLELTAPLERGELVEPEARSAVKARKPKPQRKPRPRRKAAEDKITEPALPQEEEVASNEPPEEEEATVVEFPEQEAPHLPLMPLFEPEPFVRQQRAVFGRKAG